VGFIADERNDHAVEVEEEHEQVETKLDERFLTGVSAFHVCNHPRMTSKNAAGYALRVPSLLPSCVRSAS
jgi:hypothetical protein